MIYLCQRDPRWAQKLLGGSHLTIGRFGCTTTALCMGLSAFNEFLTPDQVASHVDWYTKPGDPQGEGLLKWPAVQLPGGFHCRSRIGSRTNPCRNDAAIQASLRSSNEFVLLEVDHGQHWVLALGRTFFGNDYRVADPWFGNQQTACGTYNNITGSAHFSRV